MPGQLTNKEKQNRVHRLEVVDAKSNLHYRLSWLGRTSTVLWEQKNKKTGLWEGLTPQYLRVYTDSPAASKGEITPVLLKNIYEDGLKGVIIE